MHFVFCLLLTTLDTRNFYYGRVYIIFHLILILATATAYRQIQYSISFVRNDVIYPSSVSFAKYNTSSDDWNRKRALSDAVWMDRRYCGEGGRGRGLLGEGVRMTWDCTGCGGGNSRTRRSCSTQSDIGAVSNWTSVWSQTKYWCSPKYKWDFGTVSVQPQVIKYAQGIAIELQDVAEMCIPQFSHLNQQITVH